MIGGPRLLLVTAALTSLVVLALVPGPAPVTPADAEAPQPGLADAVRGLSSLRFEPNAGQAPEGVLFAARGPAYHVLALEDALVVQWANGEATLHLPGTPSPAEPLGSRTHIYLGADPDAWATGLPNYAALHYARPGITTIVHSQADQLRLDHIVAAGTDPGAAGFRVTGHDVRLQDDGSLAIGDALTLAAPFTYQDTAHGREEIPSAFIVTGDRVGYAVGPHDPLLPVVIDPVLRYTSFLGGSSVDYGYSIAVHVPGPGSLRHVYVGGYVSTPSPPAFPNSYGHTGAAAATGTANEAFIARLQYDYVTRAVTLQWYALIGGTGNDIGNAVAVDSAGNPAITGSTLANDFPVVNPILDASDNRGQYDGSIRGNAVAFTDVFITKLNAAGDTVLFSSYLGGAGQDIGHAIAFDGANNLIVAGEAQYHYLYQVPFPTHDPAQPDHGDFGATALRQDAFVTKLATPAGASATFGFSTFLGGTLDQRAYGVAVDAANNVIITGVNPSGGTFPATAGAFQTIPIAQDAFVAKYTPTGSLTYATLLGGSGADAGYGVDVDAAGVAWVAGSTTSGNFPVCAGTPPPCAGTPVQATLAGGTDAFLAGINSAGAGLTYGTYLGGRVPQTGSTSTSAEDEGRGVSIDPFNGHLTVVGRTQAVDFPTNGVQAATHPTKLATTTGYDAFVARIDPTSATPLTFSTYLGGTGSQEGRAVAVDDRSITYVAGFTPTGLITVSPAQATHGGSTYDAFVSIFGKAPPAAVIRLSAPTFPTVTAPPATLATFPTWTDVSVTSASVAGDAPIGSLSWELRDGATVLSTGTGTTPSFSPINLTAQGLRTVCLTVTDTDTRMPLADTTTTTCVDIQFTNRPPTALFTAVPNPTAVGTPVQFTDASTDLDGIIASRSWNFGDSTTSSQANPAKSYGAAGAFTVTLTVTDNNGATSTQTVVIDVLQPPTAGFTAAGQMFTGQSITFTDSSSDGSAPITSWTWDFGDGTIITRTTATPVTHVYATAGTFTAKLTVNDGTFQRSATRALTIGAPEPVPSPDAYTTPEDTTLTVAAPGVLANDASPTGAPLSVTAYTDPAGTLSLAPDGGLTYTPPPGFTGVDTFTYTVSAGSISAPPVAVQVTVRPFEGPTVDFVHSGAGNVVFLDLTTPGDHGLSSWLWQFPDGQTDERNPVWPLGLGTHTVTLTVTDAHGIAGSLTKAISVQRPPPVYQAAVVAAPATDWQDPASARTPSTNPPPVAMLVAPERVPTGLIVGLDGTGSHDDEGIVIPTWRQLGGPPVVLSLTHTLMPSFVAAQPGTYTFALTVSDGASTDETQATVVVVAPPPAPVIRSVEDGLTVRLVDESGAGADARRIWAFGDGSTSEGLHVQHAYAQAGTYTVTLRLERDGLESETEHTIRVAPLETVPLDERPARDAPAATDGAAPPVAANAPGAHVYVLLGILSVAIVAAVAVGMVVSRR